MNFLDSMQQDSCSSGSSVEDSDSGGEYCQIEVEEDGETETILVPEKDVSCAIAVDC